MSPALLQAVVRVADARTSDAELLARFAAARDEAAFEELVRRHGALVWAVCRQLLPHHADAEDAFQAVFLALVRGAGTIRAGQALAAWLHGVAVRVATKSKRNAARRRQRERRAATPEADRPVPDAAWAALMAAVHEEVRRLPEAERAAFVLCELEGVRQPDAAERLGWPLGTLSGRLCKARQRLIELLTRRGVAPGALAVGGLAASGGTAPAALVEKVRSFPSATAGGIPSTVAELARGLAEGVAMRTKLMAAAVLVAGALGITGGAVVLSKADAQTGGSGSSSGLPGGLPPGASPTQPGGTGALPPGGGIGGLPPGAGGGGGIGGLPPQGGGRGGAGGMGLPGPGGMMGSGMGQPGTGTAMAGVVGPGHRPWEYKFVARGNERDDFEKTLTQLGNEGWEYCGSESGLHSKRAPGAPGETVLVFKRPKGGAMMGGMGMGGMGMGGMGGVGGGMRPGGGTGGSGGGGGTSSGIRPPIGGGDEGPEMRKNLFEVIKLKTAKADDVIASLKKRYPAAKLRAVAEKESNTVIIIDVDGAVLKDVRKTIADLDRSSDPGPTPPGGGTGTSRPPGGTGGGPGGDGRFAPPIGGDPSLGPPPGVGSSAGPTAPAGEIKVLTLKHANAADITTVLERVFPSKATITAEPRTNQIIVQADQETIFTIAKLLTELDVETPKKP